MFEVIKDKLSDTLKGPLLPENENANVNIPERVLSILVGTVLTYKGIKQLFKHPVIGLQETMVGGILLYRGATGVCPIYSRLEIDSTNKPSLIIDEHITLKQTP